MHPDTRSLPPAVQTDASDEAAAALKSTFAVASVGIATLNMLETLLPAAAREVERESKGLAVNFTKLVKYITDSEIPSKEILEVIANIVMGIQFQDRNTQIMDNVTCILERYRSMLEDVCRNVEVTRSCDQATAHTISQAVEDILSSIRLSDIRHRYMEALAKAKVHPKAQSSSASADNNTGNEIELF